MVNLLKLRLQQIVSDPKYICHEVTPNEMKGGVEVTIVHYRKYNGIYATQNIEIWIVKDANRFNYLNDDKVAYKMQNSITGSLTRIVSLFPRLRIRGGRRKW